MPTTILEISSQVKQATGPLYPNPPNKYSLTALWNL